MDKCTHWRGHKFEARYTKRAPSQELEFGKTSATAIVAVMEAMSDKIYERDICVRCGATVEKTK